MSKIDCHVPDMQPGQDFWPVTWPYPVAFHLVTRPGHWVLWNKSLTTAWYQYQLPVRKPKPF